MRSITAYNRIDIILRDGIYVDICLMTGRGNSLGIDWYILSFVFFFFSGFIVERGI